MFPTDTIKLVAMTAFCVGEGVQLWMYCYFASKITAETDAVGDSAYSSEWYEADAACKRSLGIVITRAQKRTPFTVGKFTELSLDTFASILKGSYTYLMLLTEARG
ncbi:Odorant receptor 85b [Gryllus bimaculatus]|nr:Odorant receptor 85b [Gryllus bimaculatus]